jgi:hypothetical protein
MIPVSWGVAPGWDQTALQALGSSINLIQLEAEVPRLKAKTAKNQLL